MNAIEREKLNKSIIIHGRLIRLTVHSCSNHPTHCKPLVALEHPALLWMQALLLQTTMSDQLDSLEDLFTLKTLPPHLDASKDLPLWLWHSTLFRLWYYTPVNLGCGTPSPLGSGTTPVDLGSGTPPPLGTGTTPVDLGSGTPPSLGSGTLSVLASNSDDISLVQNIITSFY